MMRGPSYDDAYISRKMSQMPGPTFSSPGYGRPPVSGYMQDSYTSPYSSYSTDLRDERRSMSPSPVSTVHTSSYRPSAATQLILNRVALGRTNLPGPPPPPVYGRGYPPMGPPPRMMPRMHPSYYDYDYGYGGGYYYAPPPPPPRMSRYDSYLDDGDMMEPTYMPPRYRPRVMDVDDTEYRDKSIILPHVTSTTSPRTSTYTRAYSPGMLQDHVDKMRIRLKSLAYSLDPTGPVPEIILPERTKKTTSSSSAVATTDDKKSYSSALELSELPKLASRRQRYYPEDNQTKENLRIKCLSHYKTTRTQADYWKPKQYIPTEPLNVLPDSSSRLSKYSSSKWEEPDTVFGGPSDRKPYSKVETGSSFFSTYGITNRKKDYVAEKVRDYYYFGDDNAAKEQTEQTEQTKETEQT